MLVCAAGRWALSGGHSQLGLYECNSSSESIPGLGRSPGGGSGNQLQYSHLENSMDRVAFEATVQGITKESGMSERPSSMHTLSPCSHGYFPTCSSCNDKDTWGKPDWIRRMSHPIHLILKSPSAEVTLG